MKIKFWGLIAFDILAMCVIARTRSFALAIVFVMSLLLVNILLSFVFRRSLYPGTDSSNRIVTMLQWASWTAYIPVLGGTVCVLIGVFELAWKPCVIGAVAIVVGLWRVWSNGRVRRALQDRR